MAKKADGAIIGFSQTFKPIRESDSPYRKTQVIYPVSTEAEKRKAFETAKKTAEAAFLRENRIMAVTSGLKATEPPSGLRKIESPKPPKPKLSDEQTKALTPFPPKVREILQEVVLDTQTNSAIEETMGRWKEFSSPSAAMLVGAYLDPVARKMVNKALDAMWASQTLPAKGGGAQEVIVGGGLHAAIYCAVRAATGHEPPLVLEARDRVGGAFAISRGPSFYLNSRNRPGPLSIPGEGYGLNIIPGAMVQPSDLSGEEYQTNDVLAWVVRLTLAMYGNVVPRIRVTNYGSAESSPWAIETDDGAVIPTERIIFATGLGEPKNATGIKHERIISFDKFMQMLGEPFPLKGMRRVAVIGGGDGAKTAIEALCGQGPTTMTVASMDWPEEIDWYGATWETCLDCTNTARVRYKRLSSLLPDPDRTGRVYRVSPLGKSTIFSAGYDAAYVGQIPYDYIIYATGYERFDPPQGAAPAVVNEIRTGLKIADDVYTVGPAADLAVTDSEQEVLRNIDENKTSIFRYAMRTATLAAALD